MTIDRSLHDFNLLMKGVTKTTESEAKEQKSGFLGMLCTFCATLLRIMLSNMLTGKCVIKVWLNILLVLPSA